MPDSLSCTVKKLIQPGVFTIRAVFFLAALCLFALEAAQAQETRGLWVVRHTLTDRDEIDRLVDLAVSGNFNTLFVQVVGKGEAYYQSSILPPPESLAGNDSDPFLYLLSRARRRGLEVHAWVNCFYVWSGSKLPESPKHVVNREPEWITMDRVGRSLADYSLAELKRSHVEGIYLSPGNPRVREHIRSIAREIAGRYELDGIHLDYIRFPVGDFGYDRESRRRFYYLYRADPLELMGDPSKLARRHRQSEIDEMIAAWPRWRAERVSETVQMVSRGVRMIRPEVKLSAAVYPDPELARDKRLQDWPRWLSGGLVDFVVLMNYSTSSTVMENLYKKASTGTRKDRIYNGIGAWRISARSVVNKVIRSRRAGARGIVLFSYDGINHDPDYFNALRRGPFRRKADVAILPGRSANSSRGE
jgi:uncharacterized lipoprotein YddW (UPF0748 family)